MAKPNRLETVPEAQTSPWPAALVRAGPTPPQPMEVDLGTFDWPMDVDPTSALAEDEAMQSDSDSSSGLDESPQGSAVVSSSESRQGSDVPSSSRSSTGEPMTKNLKWPMRPEKKSGKRKGSTKAKKLKPPPLECPGCKDLYATKYTLDRHRSNVTDRTQRKCLDPKLAPIQVFLCYLGPDCPDGYRSHRRGNLTKHQCNHDRLPRTSDSFMFYSQVDLEEMKRNHDYVPASSWD